MTEINQDDKDDLLNVLISQIVEISIPLNNIHTICNSNSDNENINNVLIMFKDLYSIDDSDPILYFLDVIVIPKLQKILDIVHILEKKPWKSDTENNIKIGDRIPPPPLILSIVHFRVIYTVIEVLWQWGIQSYLKSIVNINFYDQIFPKTLILNQNEIECMKNIIKEYNDGNKCLKYINIMASILGNKLFKPTMLKRNLKRIILSLLVLTKYEPVSLLNEENLLLALKILDDFTINFPERVMVISNLRLASNGPKYLSNASCNIMTKILLSPQGLETVLLGYLEGYTDDKKSFLLQMNVAKLIISVPSGYDKEVYIKNICNQLVHLISIGCEKEDKVLIKVCAMIIMRVAQSYPKLCDEYLINSISEPLLRLGLNNNNDFNVSDEKEVDEIIISSEEEIDKSIRVVYDIINISPLTTELTNSISRTGLGQILISMYCQMLESCKSCMWLQLLQDFSIQYLSNLDVNISSLELQHVILNSTKNKISSASNGGICIKSGSPDRLKNNFTNVNTNIKNNKANIPLTPESILQFKRNESIMTDNTISMNENGDDIDISEFHEIEEMIMKTASGFLLEDEAKSNSLYIGPKMMFVSKRAKIITDLLFRTEKVKLISRSSPKGLRVKENDPNTSNSIASKLFIQTLQSFLGISPLNDESNINVFNNEKLIFDKITDNGIIKGLNGIILVTLQGHCDMSMLLQNGIQVIKLLGTFLNSHVQYLDEECNITGISETNNKIIIDLDDDSDEIDKMETCTTVLSLLASILALGNSTRPIEEENEIKLLLAPLQRISMKEKDKNIAQAASDTAFMILNRASGGFENVEEKSIEKSLNQIITDSQEYLKSESPALRSYGVKIISVAMYNCSNKNDYFDEIFELLHPMLHDNDSFVYLHVIQVLVRLADFNRQKIFDALILAFQFEGIVGEVNILLERRRSLIAEALSSILRRAGDIAPKFVPYIVTSCNKIIKSRLNEKDESRIEELVDLSSMRIKNGCNTSNNSSNNNDNDEDNNEGDIKMKRKNEKNEKKIIKAALLSDTVLLRQSAVSLLSEAISVAGWSAAIYMIDTLDIALGILTFETKSTQTNRSIRRYILHSILLLDI